MESIPRLGARGKNSANFRRVLQEIVSSHRMAISLAERWAEHLLVAMKYSERGSGALQIEASKSEVSFRSR